MAKRNKNYIWFFVIGVIVVLGALWATGVLQTAVDSGDDAYKTSVECGDNEPYIDNATFNEYAKGTGVGVTYSYTVAGGSDQARTLTPGSSGTTFAVGDKVTIFSTASGYLDKLDEITITKCGANMFTNYVYQGDAITIDILDNRNNEVTDLATASSAVNITDGGAETSATFVIEVKGIVDRSTGQVLLTLEGNDSEIDTMKISPKTAGANVIDDSYDTDLTLFTSEGTSPVIKFAFVVDEVLDDGSDEYNIGVTAETGLGNTLGGGDATGFLYVNAYAGQWFIDTDGTFKFGWEDSDGTAKYEQKAADHDALFS